MFFRHQGSLPTLTKKSNTRNLRILSMNEKWCNIETTQGQRKLLWFEIGQKPFHLIDFFDSTKSFVVMKLRKRNQKIASDKLNDLFANVRPTLAENFCQTTAIHFCCRRISHSSLCQLQHPKNWWVWETLPNKPSAGHYKIDYKVNNVYFQLSLNLLSDIFKQCINEENFPSFCKLAKLEKMTLLKCTKWTDTVPHKL